MKHDKFQSFAALVALATSTLLASAAPGSLHTAFGTGGKVTTDFGGVNTIEDLAIQPDGKIVAVGYSTVFGEDIAVLRYNSNGTPDTSFSGYGGTLTDIGVLSSDRATCVAIQPDGKIVVGGFTNAGGSGENHVVLRYNTNGTLDGTFGVNGRVIINVGLNDRPAAIALQPDGKIVLAGTYNLLGASDFSLVRLTRNGMIDRSFNGNGVRLYNFGANEVAASMEIQRDGKIVVAGYINTNIYDFAILRVLPNSNPDPSFSSDGMATVNFGGDDQAADVKVQADGKILVAGDVGNGNFDFALARLNADGTPDLPFGGSNTGRIKYAFGSTSIVKSMSLQPDGKVLVAGYSDAPIFDYNFALARHNTNGTLDTSFGTGGKVLTDFGSNTTDLSYASAIQPDGRLVLAGYSENSFALARYNLFSRVDVRIGTNRNANSGNNVYNTNGVSQTLSVTVPKSGGKKTSFLRIQNDGHETGAFTVKGTGSNKNFTVRYLSGSTNVTSNVVSGSFSTGNLASGASALLKVEVTAKTKTANKKGNFRIVASGGGTTDTVIVKAKSK